MEMLITDIKYGDLIEYHNTHSSEATMAVRKHELKIHMELSKQME